MKLVDSSDIEGCECTPATIKEAVKCKDEMLEIMDDNYGLAAPQVGIYKRFFVMKNQRGLPPWLVINPEMKPQSPKRGTFVEGCLSYPGETFRVKRYKQILASWTNENGEKSYTKMSGKEAQVFQHELDHLDGVTIKLIAEE